MKRGNGQPVIVKDHAFATFKMIIPVEDFHRDFTTLLGWSYTTSRLTIQSFLARADNYVDDLLKTNSLLWTF